MLKLTYQPELCPELSRRLKLAPVVEREIRRGALAKLGHTISLPDPQDPTPITIVDSRGRETRYRLGKILAKLDIDQTRLDELCRLIVTPVVPRVEILKGYDIARSYHDDAPPCYSCMARMDSEVFDLYSCNPNQIGLATFWNGDNYLGRCLVYCEGGKPRYRSRKIYVEAALSPICDQILGLPVIRESDWPLDCTDFDRYPYLDDFGGVNDQGLTDTDPNWTCDQTTGYAREQGQYLCDGCGCCCSEDEYHYISDQSLCESCYHENYTHIDYEPYHTDDVSSRSEWIIDDCHAARKDDCIEETSRTTSDFGDSVWVELADGTTGTLEELEDDLVYIDGYWTSDYYPTDDLAYDDYHVARKADRACW
jgi:hypothetical protein